MITFSDILKKSFIDGFANTELSTKQIIVVIIFAVLIGMYIYAVYRFVTKKTFYSKSFNISLVLMSMITAAIILTVQSSVVISLGMVGALSIVRFRTAIKEPLDIAFLFWSIAVGIILAAGMIPLAVIGSVVIGVILLFFVNKKSHKNPFIVVLACDNHDAESRALDYINSQTERCVVKSKTAQENLVEINMEVRLKDENTDFINALSALSGVKSAALVSYNGDYMG